MNYITLFLLLFSFNFLCNGQENAYVIYNQDGKEVKYKRMLKSLSKSDIVFFGELHDNAIAHWLEFELLKDLHKKRQITLGAEMFEADNQSAFDDYLRGTINEKELDSLARLWPNYSDYQPLVDYAKEEQLNVIATSIPRRFANQVYKGDWEALDHLSEEELAWIAPLPIAFDINLPSYQKILTMMGDHGSPKLVKAQAIKDATMAHFILENFQDNHLFLHVNGSWHSDNYEGIVWYVKQEHPDLYIQTISIVTQSDIDELDKEHIGVADFIICVDADIPGTY